MTEKTSLRADDINPLTGRPYSVDAMLRAAMVADAQAKNGTTPQGLDSLYTIKPNEEITAPAPALANSDNTPTPVMVHKPNSLGAKPQTPQAPLAPQDDFPEESEAMPNQASGLSNPKGLYALAMLQSMFPQHQFIPVDYNPYKVAPHIEGVGN